MSKKKPKFGYCNICGKRAKLTDDHVPPKGSITPRSVEIRDFTQRLSQIAKHPINYIYAEKDLEELIPKRRIRISQNGLKFRTICSKCNNELLGLRYDPEVKRLTQSVATLARSHYDLQLSLPKTVRVTVKTHRFVRGLLGHLLAALDPFDSSEPLPYYNINGFYKDIRDYFLDENLPIPPSVQIFYWPFPSRNQVVIKGLFVASTDGDSFVFGDLIKFFPIAYFVVDRTISNLDISLPSIIGSDCNDMNCSIKLILNFEDTPPINWPETPTAKYYTLMPLQASFVATTKSDIESP